MPLGPEIYKLLRAVVLKTDLVNRLTGGQDLEGEKYLDWGWVASNLVGLNGKAIDIGCCRSPVAVMLRDMGFDVTGVDLGRVTFELDRFQFVQGDFNALSFTPESFDVAVLCSAVEHIGLAGRYNSPDAPDGDLLAMRKVRELLKTQGRCILTTPVGIDGVFAPRHRVYGRQRFPQLIEGFTVERQRFLVKTPASDNRWTETTEKEAFAVQGSESFYALGEFVLRKG
jgi:hypothetical protein